MVGKYKILVFFFFFVIIFKTIDSFKLNDVQFHRLRYLQWNQPGCASYDSSGKCKICSTRYIRTTDSKCKLVNDLCESWNQISGLCTSCYGGYRLNNGNCSLSIVDIGQMINNTPPTPSVLPPSVPSPTINPTPAINSPNPTPTVSNQNSLATSNPTSSNTVTSTVTKIVTAACLRKIGTRCYRCPTGYTINRNTCQKGVITGVISPAQIVPSPITNTAPQTSNPLPSTSNTNSSPTNPVIPVSNTPTNTVNSVPIISQPSLSYVPESSTPNLPPSNPTQASNSVGTSNNSSNITNSMNNSPQILDSTTSFTSSSAASFSSIILYPIQSANNCSQFDSTNNCSICDQGFYLTSSSSCIQYPANCIQVLSGNVCRACDLGYSIDSSNKCIEMK